MCSTENKNQDENISEKELWWTALECNPTILTKFAHNIGCSSNYVFIDVYCLEKEYLSSFMLNNNSVASVLLLYPTTDRIKKYRIDMIEKLKKRLVIKVNKIEF